MTSGLLADCGCEEARVAFRAFLGSLGHREVFLPGFCVSRPTHRLLLPDTVPFQDLQRCRWECLLRESHASKTVYRLWLGWAGFQLQGHFRIHRLTSLVGLSAEVSRLHWRGAELVPKPLRGPNLGQKSVCLLSNVQVAMTPQEIPYIWC